MEDANRAGWAALTRRARIGVIGAGALGSLYGGAFARAGHDVQLLAREPHARAVGERGGLHIDGISGAWFAPLRAEWRGARLEPVDVLVLMCKTPDTAEALAGLDHLLPQLRIAVSWQNGLAKDELLSRWCGAERVVGGASMVGAVTASPGSVRHTFTGPTFIGELPRGTSDRTRALSNIVKGGGLPAVETDDVTSVEWSKLVQVLPAMSLTALTRLRYHEVLIDDELARAFVALVRETVAVAAAAGVTVANWPSMLPVATLAAAAEDEAVASVQAFGRSLVAAGKTEIKPSMLQSVERRRRLEVEAIQGYVARMALRLGVAAPQVTLCHRLLAAIDRSVA